ncbi:nuclease-related domain-containing protein [Curtobacterium sp. MCLR17_036]|uniref:nuclease-related domain-containing protein n=1 Tax=Curtobacterium sp. MCLR17_036 TaxID=2175620 RepID=UPI000DA92829|nr:nuclease-related domain-containing protein [Curtobacterium sp. MCLR17_036]WIE64240.1 nuclease-related domain-containing protein [Curtobacterium sp. MCLR17_036]
MSGPLETRRRRYARTADVLVAVLTILNGLSWLVGGLTSPAWFAVIVGLALAGRVARDYFRPRSGVLGTIVSIAALATAVLGGIVTASSAPVAGHVLPVHLLWSLAVVAATIARPALASSIRTGAAVDAADLVRAAEEQRIRSNRERELDHVARVERDRKWAARPSGDGERTGYEPSELVDVEIGPNPWMYGDPGAGLGGSGFDERAIERGREGEVNFARVLEQRGLLGRFATFWSVHMPDEGVGASKQLQTDIDCVVVTGSSIWLVDVKNYDQGGVRWTVEREDAQGRSSVPTLIAIDLQTEGAVGHPRKMSGNMKLARERFDRKMRNLGIRTALKPVVVMMPRDNGLGRVQDVSWPGDVPAAGLPDLLRWLEDEPDFVPSDENAELLVPILSALLKDESGSAPTLGERRLPTATATPARAVATARATATQPATEPSTAEDDGSRPCSSCGATVTADIGFCVACGAA